MSGWTHNDRRDGGMDRGPAWDTFPGSRRSGGGFGRGRGGRRGYGGGRFGEYNQQYNPYYNNQTTPFPPNPLMPYQPMPYPGATNPMLLPSSNTIPYMS